MTKRSQSVEFIGKPLPTIMIKGKRFKYRAVVGTGKYTGAKLRAIRADGVHR